MGSGDLCGSVQNCPEQSVLLMSSGVDSTLLNMSVKRAAAVQIVPMCAMWDSES